MSDGIGADFDRLARSGHRTADLVDASHQLWVFLQNGVARYGRGITNDDVGSAITQNYKPAETSTLQFLSMLYAALQGVSSGTTDLDKLLHDLENAGSVEAMKGVFNHYNIKI